jgi:RNA polymerase sigma-70 factor (ECF subfamily)
MIEAMGSLETFQSLRRLLFAIAYRMLGSATEAEDVVQEAWLRWQDADAAAIESPKAWLSTVVTRLCLDQLKSARAQREEYVGPWLPEPIRTDDAAAPAADTASISLAFLVLLESLSPAERAVYLLREVFDYSHAEVAAIVGKEEAACRQLHAPTSPRGGRGSPRRRTRTSGCSAASSRRSRWAISRG